MERREFLNILEEQIRTKRARPMIIKEIEGHIEDQKRDFMAEGMTEQEAEEAAVLEMGDPVETGAALDRIHRPKMEWSVVAGVAFISLLGLAIQYVVMLTAYPPEYLRKEIFSGEMLGRRLICMVAGMLLMLAVCWVDYTFINKYAVFLWILMNAFLVLCLMISPVINGRPYYLTYASWLIIPFFAGILYRFRGQGIKGVLKSIGCLCIPFAIMMYHFMLSNIMVTGVVGLILIHIAIYRKWFGENRRAIYVKFWIFLLLIAAVFLGIIFVCSGGRLMADYQLERIDAWLHPGKYEEYNFIVKRAGESGQFVRESSSFLTVNALDEIKNSYLWIFLFGYLGTGKGIALTLLLSGFWIFLFYIVKRQKNQSGYMIGMGCVLFLALQTVIYIGMNFSILPNGAAYLPFISGGETFLLISYFYMGILLSVCNNSRVVED